jgi:hypothetical protein
MDAGTPFAPDFLINYVHLENLPARSSLTHLDVPLNNKGDV